MRLFLRRFLQLCAPSLAVILVVAIGKLAAQSPPSPPAGGLTYNYVPGPVQWNGYFKAKQDWPLPSYVVSTLPTCNGVLANSFAVVSDALSPSYGGSLTGGGSVITPVFCDGGSWTSH
jgi:hypothetical protein